MTRTQWSRAVTVTGAALIAVALVLGLTPNPAGSATQQIFRSRAEAKALTVSLGGTDLLLGDPRVADSSQDPPESGDTTGSLLTLPLLGDLLAAGVAAQDAAVDDFGNSAACAGLVGPGGALQVSAEEPPECTEVLGTPAGLIVNVSQLGLLRLRADAVVAECTANAAGGAQSTARVANLAIDIGVPLPLFPEPLWIPALAAPITIDQPDTPVLPILQPLGGLLQITVHDVPGPHDAPVVVEPGVAETTALHVSLLNLTGDPLVDIAIGHVRCGPNSGSTAQIDLDTSGSLSGATVQDQTENMLLLRYRPDTDRTGVVLGARIGEGLVVDQARGLPAGCAVSVDGTVTPPQEVVTCPVGDLAEDELAQRLIPVEIEPGAGPTVSAQLVVLDATGIAAGPVIEEHGVLVETTGVSGDAGGLAVPDPNRTGLPLDIDGTLYLDVPDYVEDAAYGGTPCVQEVFDPADSVYPAVPGNLTFSCGNAVPQGPGSEPALAFTYADDAPETAGTPDPGRVVIVREGAGVSPQEAVGNSYYANLDFFVDEAVVPPTQPTVPPTQPTVPPTQPTVPPTQPTVPPTQPTLPPTLPTLPPTLPTLPPTLPTTPATVPTSVTTPSTIGGASSTLPRTSSTARPLARTGSNTRTTLSIALGLLGAGMVVTGRGMQAEVTVLGRRRRS